ncbi:sugar phosphate isomerase/epimerase [Streptomyces coeruleorubidus]|uniref:sugar phosphate isomerase/epimerase family protein n=1 Tax=Streptomyces coeruleorubidus TaxID=116188 RepID=UPI00237EF55D|nr:sugar phosphate isomerase/epimerase family protein [Streptomyces coeruleorubidus]WDV53252.1 sugar phosphate isomerase/epimerase [Streptomyces coeruleorubidus]
MNSPTASPFPFPYGVNQFTTMPWSFEEDLAHYARLGIEAMELCETKLHDDHDRAKTQLASVAGTGLPISSVQPLVRTVFPSETQPDPAGRRDRLARFRRSVELIAPFAPGAVFVTNTGPAPDGNLHEAVRQVVTHHRELADIAADHGVRIALEPLNPVLLNAETAIWTYRQALDVIQEVDRENVGVCLDLWNLWQDPDLVPGLADAPDRLFLLQVSDWRTPRSRMDRRTVGTGDIPVGRLLHAAHDAGYRGPCVLEIFSDNVPDSLYETDLDDLLRTNRTALESAWRTAAG